jgi:hypothetical protein
VAKSDSRLGARPISLSNTDREEEGPVSRTEQDQIGERSGPLQVCRLTAGGFSEADFTESATENKSPVRDANPTGTGDRCGKSAPRPVQPLG